MIKNIKILIVLTVCAILLVSCASQEATQPTSQSNNDYAHITPTEPRNYDVIIDPADKEVLSDFNMGAMLEPPSMDLNLKLAEVAIDGKIINFETKTFNNPFYEEFKESGYPKTLDIHFFVIHVNKTIRGKYSNDIIYLMVNSGINNPNLGENVIFFADERILDEFSFYVPLSDEHSMFVYEDKTERLYSFSNIKELSDFDGKNKSELYDVVQKSEIFGTGRNWENTAD
ncbi:MAG: hypothetical protein FWG44_00860 [Oscillospiraceae bacterium]|nr:hypothetical protein [Oscillospiraceae bacterium]